MADQLENFSGNFGGTVLITSVADWLMQQALGQARVEDIFEGCCIRLDAAGVPIARAMLTFRTLHPLYASTLMFWRRGENVTVSRTRHEGAFSSDEFMASPIRRLLTSSTPFLRRKLNGDTAMFDFPVLEELAEQGNTDYLAYKVGFASDNTEGAESELDTESATPALDQTANGIIGSWCTERPGGFTDQELVWLMRVQSRLAVTCKVQIQEGVTHNVLDAYLGPQASHRVLGGQIRHGDGERINAIIWYSDMRDSTVWADNLKPDEFLNLVNSYFECTAGAVLAQGGEVLRFIGDAVLAIFPVEGGSRTSRLPHSSDSRSQAAQKALAAANEALTRLAELNRSRSGEGLASVEFGLGLHIGELTFGNIGVAERLEFSVVGPAANEVARLEALSKKLQRRILASEDFANLVEAQWESMGEHRLRGVGEPINVLSPIMPQHSAVVQNAQPTEQNVGFTGSE